jgi:hypothetical protein
VESVAKDAMKGTIEGTQKAKVETSEIVKEAVKA